MEKFGLAHISAGDLLRAEVAAGTDAGKRAKSFMDNGDLVPDEVSASSCAGILAATGKLVRLHSRARQPPHTADCGYHG